jgi:anaerobic magnesium-protoporphyrin IX monomethyl ester cyclase
MKSPRTLFIAPPYYSLRNLKPGPIYSLGILYLAGYLRKNGFESRVVISDILVNVKSKIFISMKSYSKGWENYKKYLQRQEHPIWKKIETLIREYEPSLVGISTNSPTINSAYKVASIAKKVDKNICVLIGGFHGTFCPEEVLLNESVDFVIRGEGEIPILRFVDEMAAGTCRWEEVPSLSYREKNFSFRHNRLSEKIPDLDYIPFPARDLIVTPTNTKQKEHTILATRGCPYGCAFCADKRFWGDVRMRSKENIVDEMETILKQFPDTKKIYFTDGTLTFNKQFVGELCGEILKRKIRTELYCTARFDNIDEEILGHLKRAGFQALYLGAESGDHEILRSMNKRITLDQIENSIHLIRKAGIKTLVSILVGVPGENENTLRNTIQMMERIPADAFDINCFVPLPGTAWYDKIPEGIRQKVNWLDIGYKSGRPFLFEVEGKENLFKYVDRISKIADQRLRKTIAKAILSKILYPIRLQLIS